MAAINFPIPSFVGETYTFNGTTWTWNGYAWVLGSPAGPQGALGFQGAQGLQGFQGSQGVLGAQGVQGFQGSGTQGIAGSQGSTGPSGETTVVPLTDGATINTDASLGNMFTVTLGGNRLLGNPTNSTNGKRIIWRVKQDGTGNRILSFDTNFRFGTDITAIVLSTAPDVTDYFGAIYNSNDDKWDFIAFVKGFS
jgi:hypothetical protein